MSQPKVIFRSSRFRWAPCCHHLKSRPLSSPLCGPTCPSAPAVASVLPAAQPSLGPARVHRPLDSAFDSCLSAQHRLSPSAAVLRFILIFLLLGSDSSPPVKCSPGLSPVFKERMWPCVCVPLTVCLPLRRVWGSQCCDLTGLLCVGEDDLQEARHHVWLMVVHPAQNVAMSQGCNKWPWMAE